MTIIEFFDPEMLENIISALLLRPTRVVLFGKDGKKLSAFQKTMTKILIDKGIETEVVYRSVNTQDYQILVQSLTNFTLEYTDCVFDLTGGEDLVLVAMGAVAREKHIPLHRINPRLGTVKTILQKEKETVASYAASLSVPQAISLFGGSLKNEGALYQIKNTIAQENGEKDIALLFQIMHKNPGLWNAALDLLSAYTDEAQWSFDGLTFPSPFGAKNTLKEPASQRASYLEKLLCRFTENGLLTEVDDGINTMFRAKDKLILTALSKSGTVLELYTLMCVLNAQGQNWEKLLSDAVSGAEIDWEFGPDTRDELKNEIDVLATCGTIPVFISCKNGSVDADELYKLNTVAQRFGGKYAKKILVMTGFHVRDSFLFRAQAMNIHVIRNTHTLSREAFIQKLENAILH